MNILDEFHTLEKLEKGYSIARFGDGEFSRIIMGVGYIALMQQRDQDLKEKLISVLTHPYQKLIIGIPNPSAQRYWVRNFMVKFEDFIKDKETYTKSTFGSAFITRPSIMNLDNDFYFDKFKSILKGRELVILNFNDKLLVHDLFRDNYSVFIEIPRRNCFSKYKEIFERCEKYFKKGMLFLASAGPTATCLAYDLYRRGEQCIDIGQIVFEYSLFKGDKDLEYFTSQGTYRRKK